jgi:hypothetical protein
MTSEQWTSLVEHALWPAVVVTLGLVLRKPIAAFLGALAGRVTKVSVMSVSVELAVARPADPPWRGVGGDDVRGLVVAQQVNDSYFLTLREALRASGSADYFVVDLRNDGDEWLTSRLYVFSYLLGRLKGIRAVVFVATRGDVAGSFLAVGRVDRIMRTLAMAQPWLREARLEAEANQVGRLPNPATAPPAPVPAAPTLSVPADVDEWWEGVRAGTIYADPLQVAQQFLSRMQWEQPPGMMDPDSSWLRLPDQPGRPTTWEHAAWVRSADVIDGFMRDSVEPDWWIIDDRSWTAEERVRSVAAAPGDFVALLRPTRRFDRLIDRRSLLTTLGESCATSATTS